MANTYLSRTPATVGNQKTFTTSFWVKRATGTIANISTPKNCKP